MQIGGLIKLSLIDYPGKIAAVIFCQGCNFRCPYCHNKELVIPACFGAPIPEQEIISFLVKRQGLLDGVVVSGGEPTLQRDIVSFLRKIKSFGFSVKLDTNGSRPDVLEEVIFGKWADFIAMDIKASLERYQHVAGVEVKTALIRKSIEMIKRSGIEHQFRTTVVKDLVHTEDFPNIRNLVEGTQSYVLQNFVARENILDPALMESPVYTEEEFGDLREKWSVNQVG